MTAQELVDAVGSKAVRLARCGARTGDIVFTMLFVACDIAARAGAKREEVDGLMDRAWQSATHAPPPPTIVDADAVVIRDAMDAANES